jgi:putative peptide zinc metalloprotease protein
MAEANSTFSESWYRIANKSICLRPGVRVRRQNYRGERWFVIENPFSNEFFRVRPAAYEFIARLRADRTVEETWKECVERFPDEAPGQDAVLQLLAQLYHANLLQYDEAADSSQLFERFKKRRQREVASQLMNIMFMRFPLLDPDRFLVRTLPLVGKLISPVGAVVWLAVVAWAGKLAMDNWEALRDQSQSVLSPQNLPLLYVALILIKTLHEFGHAYFCRKFGGEVHVMGILLMIFTPVPYMDATSSWAFRSRWKRLVVGGAGMLVEVFVAAIAVFVWANTGPGAISSLAYNMIFVASVSTLVFNLNPLLRFDGYYMLSDLLEIPNLSQRSNQQLRYYCERYLFGITQAESPAGNGKEAGWYVVFGITSGIYRVIVFGGVLLFVADQLLFLGVLMALACAISWIIVPSFKLVQYLGTSPKLDRVRPRAIGVTAGLLAVIILLLGVVPWPSHFRAPGVVQAQERSVLVNNVDGIVARVLAQPGHRVSPGQPLLELDNEELRFELRSVRARVAEVEARLRRALTETNADLAPLYSSLHAVTNHLAKLQRDEAQLTVRARHSGFWVAPGVQQYVGRRLPKGTPVGLLVEPGGFEFVATIPQADADALFGRKVHGAEVRLNGQAGAVTKAQNWRVVPGGQNTLPSAALGWAAGGEVPVAADQPSQSTEPFFEVLADFPQELQASLVHGRSGKIRFDLDPEPLLQRWFRRLQQLLQKRYQL